LDWGGAMRRGLSWISMVLGIALATSGAEALVTRLMPLAVVLKETSYVCMAKVAKLDADRPVMMLTVTEDLKGKLPFRRLTVGLKGDSEARKGRQTPQLLKRLAPELPLVLFVSHEAGKQVMVFAYSNGTWFQMIGRPPAAKDDALVLGFTHLEPYLRRTFKGTTAELRQVIVDGLSGKRAPPGPDPKELPGLGPEIRNSKSNAAASRFELRASGCCGGPLFAVIPTLGLGGPLAILALLFPSLFGGVLLLFRRWTAFVAVLSINGLLLAPLLASGWFGWTLPGTWWGSSLVLWLAMTLVTLLGLLWAWRRHLTALQEGHPDPPARTEHLVLWLLSLGCGLAVLFYWLDLRSSADPTWRFLLALSVGIWAGTLYKLYCSLLGARRARPHLPTEGVILWASLVVFLVFAATRTTAQGVTTEVIQGQADRPLPKFLTERKWAVLFSDRASGGVYSSPCLDGERAYVSVAHRRGFQTFGAVYCLDLKTKKVLWSFDADGAMKQVYSSPRLAAGKLYVGEGFHDDPDCKLYCLEARTGKQIWAFPTSSQTESSVCIAAGKVYFGAGNDGLYAVDAASGKKLWQYPLQQDPSAVLRIGATPTVVGNRLYVGSGVDRNHPEAPGETAVFCLDADTGRLIWKVKTDLPAWGGPAAAGEQVFFPLGNGDVAQDATHPAGALLCLEAGSGKAVWRTDVPNGVLSRPAVDRDSVYFGCRDGRCYCLNRYDGSRRWAKDLGSPVIGSPVLDPPSPTGRASAVFVAAERGRVACLDPRSGAIFWAWDELTEGDHHLLSTPRLVVQPGPSGDRRLLYLGAVLNGDSLPALYGLEDFWPH
jgi:outer membrane protein assembly factor BamB